MIKRISFAEAKELLDTLPDKVLLEMIDANTIAVDSLADKTDLLYECDRSGTVVWYDMPYTGGEADFDELRAFLTQHRHHPSLAFVCCAEEADAAYAERFFAVCRACAPEVFTALRHAIAPRLRGGEIVFDDLKLTPEKIRGFDRIFIVACGSSYHVGMVGKYNLEHLLRRNVEVAPEDGATEMA